MFCFYHLKGMRWYVMLGFIIPNNLICGMLSAGIHGATSQKMAFFIATAVKTSNLT
jgi:hypothetical protein